MLCFREADQEKLWQLQERKLLEDTLETARRSEKARRSFFANMSHDMRTPLNAIIGMSELARRTPGNGEKIAGYLDKIHYSSFQLKNLIDDILNLSRMEEGRLDLNNQKIDLRQCVQDCLEWAGAGTMRGAHANCPLKTRRAAGPAGRRGIRRNKDAAWREWRVRTDRRTLLWRPCDRRA